MYKFFVITYAGGKAIDTKVIEYDSQMQADKAAELLFAAAGKSFNVTITKLY